MKFVVTKELAYDWQYFEPLVSKRWSSSEITFPPNVNFSAWYDLVILGRIVKWSDVHEAVDYFIPTNNKWLLNTILDVDEEHSDLFEEVGQLIREEGGQYPYISNKIIPQIHGNFFLYCDPIYDRTLPKYQKPLTEDQKDYLLGEDFLYLSELTGVMHTGWLRSVVLRGTKEPDYDENGNIKEVPWDLISWNYLMNVPTNLLYAVKEAKDVQVSRESVVQMLSFSTDWIEIGSIIFPDHIPKSENSTFVQYALINHFYYLDNPSEKHENVEADYRSPTDISFDIDISLRYVGNGYKVWTDLPNPLSFYNILLDVMLFHTNVPLREICYYAGLDGLISVKLPKIILGNDAIKLIRDMSRQIVYHGNSKEGLGTGIVKPSEYEDIIEYADKTVGSDALYTIATFAAMVVDKEIARNDNDLLLFAEMVDETPDNISPQTMP